MKNIMEQLAAGLKNGPLAILATDVSHVSFGRLAPYILTGLAAYPVLCSFLRFRKMRWLHRKYNFPTRESLARMTDDEAWEIQRVLLQQEFPFFFIKALQFALFRTYGIPTISGLLTATSQLSNPETSLKRYTDTSVLIQEFMGNAPSSERACTALARTRFLHTGYRAAGKIQEDDMLYTLGLFAIQPVRFIEKFEWRTLSDMEKCAMGTFWKSIGDGLDIGYENLPSSKTGFRDGLHWLEEIMAWSDEYEVRSMLPDMKNRETADQTTAVLLYMIPSPLQHIGLKFVSFMMDDRLRKAMLYDAPPAAYTKVFSFLLRVRRFIMRYLALPRPYFLRYEPYTERPDEHNRIFITQWDAAPYYVKPTFWNRWGPTAWLTWALGKPLPGDMGDKYYPQGYYTADVGPRYFEGKGQQTVEKITEELKVSRAGKCPFM
ncbi:uncharacterized protein NFIA_014740 [Aspergillus fischeri NRRL 181]|uniref:ER-bound oxygenase mpaB/mpaB'/Rubber oxygenase catalytic domain-containing protein n=1 Tax=Neosartorya fischeri (strain ATCC 1020 / DSM 3700 / CBS 544.65 / FGSC A1164 / JCM 1740 / NRRL 181 / WB 181) TaxID=331117 RepID=A1D2Y9_NEOFI|nr:conserved hypothetical protein [Aspergillus fischeri NRRL 181]EAW22782.1 conserved hypothetical protein [Aspergillus fischeri NRRL 181]KAG2022060.1 hypothetical protein GB937_004154 [Aspergillus fischeri]